MVPILAAAFVAASFAGSVYANKKSEKIQQQGIQAEMQQARLQAAEAAYERTKTFRQNTSMNLALQGMGFGSAANLAALGAENFEDYMMDISAIKADERFAMESGRIKSKAAKYNRRAADINAVSNAAQIANTFNLFKTK